MTERKGLPLLREKLEAHSANDPIAYNVPVKKLLGGEILKQLQDIDSVTAVAVDPGNAGASEYMRGMANGLILAQSIVRDTEPQYIDTPMIGVHPLDNADAVVRDFIPNSLRTCSDSFHGSKVPVVVLINAVAHVVQAAERLDDVKKVLFYGVETPKGAAIYERLIGNFPMLGVSQFDETVAVLSDDVPERERDLLHGILGVLTEAGELGEILQNYLLGETPDLDPVHMAEECGDDMWYRALIFNRIGTTFPAEMDRVIRKLRTRFPDKFTEQHAGQRDLAAERATLETGFPTPDKPAGRVSPRTSDMSDICRAETGRDDA